MNTCILMAEIVKDPELRYTQENNLAVTEMTVQFSGLRDDDPPATLKVVSWGNLAQEVQERYRTGDRVIIEGRLGMNMVDRPEGFKEKRAELTAQKVHLLGADASLTTSAVDPSPTTASTSAPVSQPAAQPAPKATAQPAPRPAAPRSSAPAEPAKTPAYAAKPAAESVDYDEIPFVRPVESRTAGTDSDLVDYIDQNIHRPRVGFEFHRF